MRSLKDQPEREAFDCKLPGATGGSQARVRGPMSDCEQVVGRERGDGWRRAGRPPGSQACTSLSRCESETWRLRSNARGFSSNRSCLCPERQS